MLSNILICLMAVLCVACYRLGLRDGRAMKDDAPLPQAVKLPRKAPRPTERDLYYNTILKNIDAYDGTGAGQQEVKR